MPALLLAAAAVAVGAGDVPPVRHRPSQPAQAAAMSVIDAERAFAEDARKIGQWATFRKWAATDAVMFDPQPVDAQAWLKARAEPAATLAWWPTEAWISCDGRLAIDTGSWQRSDDTVGYFTTVWSRQPNGAWRWVADHGDALLAARSLAGAARGIPTVTRASCQGEPTAFITQAHSGAGARFGNRGSADRTLRVGWEVDAAGRRWLDVWLWDGTTNVLVLSDQVGKP